MRKSRTISAPREHKDRSFLLAIIKGSLIALCISLVGILIFAFILSFSNHIDILLLLFLFIFYIFLYLIDY